MDFDLVVINGDSFSEGNGLYRQFDTFKEECKYYDYWLELKKHSSNEVFLDRSFSWGLKIAELLNVPLLNIAKSGSSNKSILRRWYYLMGIVPNNNLENIVDYRIGEDHWIFLNPNKKDFTKFDKSKFQTFKNPLCITQWSGSFRADMTYKASTFALNPGMLGNLDQMKNWLEETNLPFEVEKFHTFYKYFSNLIISPYLVHYENLNHLMAYKGLMESKGIKGFSIPNRLSDVMEFNYDTIMDNVLPYQKTKEIEMNTYTLKDVGIDNLHFSLEGHEYYGESMLNLIKEKIK
jgi:hypothetical protein